MNRSGKCRGSCSAQRRRRGLLGCVMHRLHSSIRNRNRIINETQSRDGQFRRPNFGCRQVGVFSRALASLR